MSILTTYLTTQEIVNGIFSLLIVILSVSIGSYIASKYFKYDDKIFLYIGISWIGLNQGWYPSCISFLTTIISGMPIPDPLYFLIGNIGVPPLAFIWMIAMTDLMFEKRKTGILSIYGVFVAIYEIILILFLFIDPTLIGETTSAVDVKYSSFFGLYLIAIILIIMITGILFAAKSIKSENVGNRLKGKFLLIGFITYFIGAMADALLNLNIILLPIIRIVSIFSGFMFYLGWILPDSIKNKFGIKE
ncbi:MAG: conserved membrane protein of unknown function [Promethearchaeota archaeon]|nr:MAG: conserved membrane protein of unknown function [Candidatus Lokiarchaeota archaeon]